MNAQLPIRKDALEILLSARKIAADDARLFYDDHEGEARMTLQQLERLAAVANVSLAYVVRQLDVVRNDLCDGVKISGRQTRFDRLKEVAGVPAYFYRHVLKTSADPHLMVLRTTPLFTAPGQVSLNAGHQAREFVYVLRGAVGVLWRNSAGVQRQDVLAVGDSMFIEAWVPHAFYAREAGSQILAVDYHRRLPSKCQSK